MPLHPDMGHAKSCPSIIATLDSLPLLHLITVLWKI
jgi:hypothetical protein